MSEHFAIPVKLGKGYEVQIGGGILPQIGTRLKELLPKAKKVVVVSDGNVAPLYGSVVTDSLKGAEIGCHHFTIPAGEKSKNGKTYLELLEFLAGAELTRADCLIALGGGVVGDLAGFAAATYQRGVDYIQLPTTLLSAVDASVGGKTAIDLEGGKNLAGAFHQPRLVLCDVDTLKTLPDGEIYNGCAEVIKYAMLDCPALLEALKNHQISGDWAEIISHCVTKKRDIVEADEFDRKERQLLNLGHTLGHAIEQCSGYSVPHGFAVGAGLSIITRAAVAKNQCTPQTSADLDALLAHYQLPQETEFTTEELLKNALKDKKRAGDSLTLVVPEALGKSRLLEIPAADLKNWIEMGRLP